MCVYVYKYIHLYKYISTHIAKMCVCHLLKKQTPYSSTKDYLENIKMILAKEKDW